MFSNETPRLILYYKHLANNKIIVYKKAVLNKLPDTSYRWAIFVFILRFFGGNANFILSYTVLIIPLLKLFAIKQPYIKHISLIKDAVLILLYFLSNGKIFSLLSRWQHWLNSVNSTTKFPEHWTNNKMVQAGSKIW